MLQYIIRSIVAEYCIKGIKQSLLDAVSTKSIVHVFIS